MFLLLPFVLLGRLEAPCPHLDREGFSNNTNSTIDHEALENLLQMASLVMKDRPPTMATTGGATAGIGPMDCYVLVFMKMGMLCALAIPN